MKNTEKIGGNSFLIRAALAAVLSVFIGFFALTSLSIASAAVNPVIPIITPENNAVSNDSETAVLQENPGTELAPDEGSALYDLIGIDASQPLEVILLITVLSVAPSILLMMTCYTRIIIVFSFLRSAMQTPTTPPNQVLTGMAIFLTIFIMWPTMTAINEVAYKPYNEGQITAREAVDEAAGPLKDFMLRQTSNKNMRFFLELGNQTLYKPGTEDTANPESVVVTDEINLDNYREQLKLPVVIPAFMVSELSRAFQMGFILFMPFLIIDIVVASTLMSMGMMMLPPAMISLPFKIMLFVLVDGWQMLVGSLVQSFN
ncbi:MAG: flagellar type III secretion system pore protein FliP [Oscillospiraceae bacterium]|jgi:flagellar biosynthetic protein FliP|nr:flagellar type III secretion system pore protein FliP [Oscillospiraceae bacterium]